MSNRTICEFNHDFAHEIDQTPDVFVEKLARALRSGWLEEWHELERFGLRRIAMRHHSTDGELCSRAKQKDSITMTPPHSPLPWTVGEGGRIRDATDDNVALITHDDDRASANAALIVTAVNSHAKMKAALEPFAAFAEKAERFIEDRVRDGGSPIMPTSDFRLADFLRARAALAGEGNG